CKAPWENMDGDNRIRFCRECSRNVYNLSAMTECEARRVIAEREGRLCVRFYQRRDGTVLTSDCPVGAKRSFFVAGARAAALVAGAAAGITALAACNSVEDEPVRMGEPLTGSPPAQGDWDAGTGVPHEPEHPEEPIMGDIALPPEQPLMGKVAPLRTP
ncbi:MAG: hypothetical protein GQ551_13320, partial [Myxococcales bacterium]|nr:hypothetical protein [Myxococcales bacterium]